MSGSATTLYSFLSPVRTEITNQLNIVTNTAPLDAKRLAALKVALRTIDRPTATNLTIDLQALNVLVVGLGKSSLSNTFLPLLDTAADNYFDLLTSSYTNLTNQLVVALPSGVKNAASNNLAQLFLTLQKASTNNLPAAVKLLGQAGAKLRTSTLLVTRALAVLPGPNTLTANIGGTAFAVRGLLGSGHPTGVLGVYEPGIHRLTISAAKVVGANVKSLSIAVGNIAEGTTVHSLNGDGVATYIMAGLAGNGASTSTTGTMTVTMNSAKQIMSGSFSITMAGTAINSTMTGTFFVNY